MIFKHSKILCATINESKSVWQIENVDPDNQTGAIAAVIVIWKVRTLHEQL